MKPNKTNNRIYYQEHGKRPEALLQLEALLSELLKLRYDETSLKLTPSQFNHNRNFILERLSECNFEKVSKNKYYDNIKRFNNILVQVNNLLDFDFSMYKIKRTAAGVRNEMSLFAYEKIGLISEKDMNKLLKVA